MGAGARGLGSACPAPSSLSVLELRSHTHPAPGGSWRPSGKEQLRLFLAFLEEPPLERERGLGGEGSREQPRRAQRGGGMRLSGQALPVTALPSPGLLLLGDERSTVPRGCCGEGRLCPCSPRARPALRTGLLSAAPASPEEFAAPASAAGSGEIAACLA